MTEQTTESIAAALDGAESTPAPVAFLSAREVLSQLASDPTVGILAPMLVPVLDAIDAANSATAKSKAVGGKLNKENKVHRQQVWESHADSNEAVKSDVDIRNQLLAQIEEVEKRLSDFAVSNWPAEVSSDEIQQRKDEAKAKYDAAEAALTPNKGLFIVLSTAMRNAGLPTPEDANSLIPKLESPSRIGKGAGKGTTRGPQKIRAEKVVIDGNLIQAKMAGGTMSSSFGAIDTAGTRKALDLDLTSDQVHDEFLKVLSEAGYETDPDKRNQNEYPVYTKFYMRVEKATGENGKSIPVMLTVEITRSKDRYSGTPEKAKLIQALPDEMKASESESKARQSAKK